jgi:hypothetical protein
MTGRIAIALGDITGIGPEVTLKALAQEAGTTDTSYLLLGDLAHTQALLQKLGLQLPLEPYHGPGSSGRFAIHSPLPQTLPADLPPGSPTAAHAAMAAGQGLGRSHRQRERRAGRQRRRYFTQHHSLLRECIPASALHTGRSRSDPHEHRLERWNTASPPSMRQRRSTFWDRYQVQ